MEGHGLDAAIIATVYAPAAEVIYAPLLGQVLPVKYLTGNQGTLSLEQATEVLIVTVPATRLVLWISRLRKAARPPAHLALLAVTARSLDLMRKRIEINCLPARVYAVRFA
jgi:hypothetical protein